MAQSQLIDPKYTIHPREGLHRIKSIFNKTWMGEQCRQLLADLDLAIQATRELAPVRNQGYLQHPRSGPGIPNNLEARWERGIWQQWSTPSALPIPGAWHRIVTYQENLPASQDNQGWGEIDLLGASSCGLPVVVELKAPNPEQPESAVNDTPPGAMIQAVAYAIVLQKAWPMFRQNWANLVAAKCGFRVDVPAPNDLRCCPVVVAATKTYWDEWIGQTPRAKTVTPETWQVVSQLVAGFALAGYPTTFVSLEAESFDNGIPVGIRASAVLPYATERSM